MREAIELTKDEMESACVAAQELLHRETPGNTFYEFAKDLCDSLREHKDEISQLRHSAANNLPIPVFGVTWMDVELLGRVFKQKGIVVRDCICDGVHVIVGMNILQELDGLLIKELGEGNDKHINVTQEGLKEALKSWGLKEELQVCITTDNGANIVKAVEINGWTRLQCFGHRLHLAIERSVKDARVEHAIGKCKKIVSAFSYAWKRKREMANAQAELNLPPHRLITETPTRWGSRQQMIQRLLEQEKAISQVLKADRKTRHLVPTWQDIDVLESMNKTLSPLLEFTDALSGEEYVSVSTVKPVLHLLNTTVLPLADDDIDTELMKDMKTAILNEEGERKSRFLSTPDEGSELFDN
ncbi:E3 SUMO-protein ligase ZBED1-like [Bufo bufo]|uniref:E3 SUMO-protein ligase ZBED1-like n=1 Tax=Bufo bufo TaxID=8384 RepID=UPI001ABDACA2|nr:E3 SUMO-protein ligase ZBED1-like [Bufo bufo]